MKKPKMNVLVTGASGNLGSAVVEKFLALGSRVIGVMRSEKEFSFSSNPLFSILLADLEKEESGIAVAEKAWTEMGNIDLAVFTTGGYSGGDLETTTTESVHQMLSLNFDTVFNIARPVFLKMKEAGEGRIFITGAKTGRDMQLSRNSIAYGLSKSLVFRLAELFNDEAKNQNVLVSVLSPGIIDTPQNRNMMPDADPSRWTSPSSIADRIALYARDEHLMRKNPVIPL